MKIQTQCSWLTGDTLFYACDINSNCEENEKENTTWGYKFTVTAGTRDSFDTGYAILNNVLSTSLAL